MEITLVEPLPYFPQLLTFSNVTPVPEAKTEGDKNSSYGATAEELAQSGPFYVTEWTRGSKVVLEKNPNYWDAENVKLDEVELVLAQDENTRQQLFDQNKVNVIENVSTQYLEQKQARCRCWKSTVSFGPQPRNSYICFNNEDPNGVFTNEKIRKAFAIAFDREAYATQVLKKTKLHMQRYSGNSYRRRNFP